MPAQALVDPDILKEVQESQAEMHRNLNRWAGWLRSAHHA
jgi:hypothetical protein